RYQINQWTEDSFQQNYELFVHYWLNHKVRHQCIKHCTRSLTGDGIMKLRRRICFSHSKSITTPEFDSIQLSKHLRACGYSLLVTNCGIIIGYAEMLRSEETIKVLINNICNIIKISPNIPDLIFYDDACHLVKFICNHYRKEINETAAMTLLWNKRFLIDKFHYHNHVDPWCRRYLDYRQFPETEILNSQSCEQTNSWLGRYKYIVSEMNYSKANSFLLIIFHYYNLKKLINNVKLNNDTISKINDGNRAQMPDNDPHNDLIGNLDCESLAQEADQQNCSLGNLSCYSLAQEGDQQQDIEMDTDDEYRLGTFPLLKIKK
ncbi:unnamed protein product, partial [Didymodactylos carnosus]